MDGDPSVEPELDSFSLFLPLPYRVALIIVLGRDTAIPLRVQPANRTQASGHGVSIFTISI